MNHQVRPADRPAHGVFWGMNVRRLLPLAMAVILAGCAAAAVAGAAWGAALLAAGGVCDHAAPDASSETEPAKIKPAAIRIVFSLNFSLCRGGFLPCPALPAP